MTDTFRLHPQMLALMRMQSDAVLARRPEVVGPYRMPEPPPRPVMVPVAEVPAEPVVEPTPGQRAEAFLQEVLTPDAVPALKVQAMAKDASVAARTLRRARERMKVRTFKRSGVWWWQLAAEDGPSKGGRIPARPSRRKVIADPFA
jgi:hypothetical protein